MNYVQMLNEIVFDGDVLSVQASSSATPLDDGYMCKLSALVTNERDLYTVVVPADITVDDMVIIVGAETYIDSNGYRVPIHDKTAWTYAGDRPVRAYRPRAGMRFIISNTAISGTPVEGEFIIAQNASYTLAASASAGSGLVVFQVEETSVSMPGPGKNLTTGTLVRVKKGL